jgi:hypothetical protein
MRPERFRLRQARRIGGGQIDDEAHNSLSGEVAASDAEAANFDQPGELAGRPDHELPIIGFKMDTIIADQHRRW